jgi:drug/metabolite transporter (DMT)-like permease
VSIPVDQKRQRLTSNLLLWTAATIWGFAFVAQRVGMRHVGPFTFIGVRFLIGALSLAPLLLTVKRERHSSWRGQVAGCAIVGLVLFCGATLQQVGLIYTTAGKAGFITGLYVVLVPLFGLLLGHSSSKFLWAGSLLAAVGLFLLSATETWTIQGGDLLVLAGAAFWALHILSIAYFSRRIDGLVIAVAQFFICGSLSLVVAFAVESPSLPAVLEAAVPILYGGLLASGVAFTMQIYGQKHAHPAAASIIMVMESPIAAFGGWLVLGESFSTRGLLGCVLMLGGMIVSQLPSANSTPPGGAVSSGS